MASVAESGVTPASRRRRFSRRRIGQAAAPYVLLAPAAAVIGLVLAYPLFLLVKMSFQKYGLFELIQHQGKWVGTANYASIFHDGEFWHVVLRTLIFTTVCVSLTMIFGTAIALLRTAPFSTTRTNWPGFNAPSALAISARISYVPVVGLTRVSLKLIFPLRGNIEPSESLIVTSYALSFGIDS